MITLNIPVYTQHNAVTCGPYCVKMVLSYLGIEKSIDEIKISCNYCAHGTLETGLVLGLSELGVKSRLVMASDGEIIRGKYKGMPLKELSKALSRRASHSRRPLIKRGFTELSKIVEQEQIEIGVPTRSRIEEEISKGNPWIAVVSSFALYGYDDDKKRDLLHFVVISGYDEHDFIINDPAPSSEGRQRKIPKDLLLHSMYSSESRAICVYKSDILKKA